MRNLSIIRNCAFVLFCAVTAFAFEERLLAAMGDSLKNACQGWVNRAQSLRPCSRESSMMHFRRLRLGLNKGHVVEPSVSA